MKFNILTLFPEIFPGPLNHSLAGKALKKKIFEVNAINIRDFSRTKSKTVDDKPFGGGAGMVIKPDVLQNSLNYAKKINKKVEKRILYFSPSGKKINQKFVNDLIGFRELVLICGKYEGVDQRFIDYNKIEEIS